MNFCIAYLDVYFGVCWKYPTKYSGFNYKAVGYSLNFMVKFFVLLNSNKIQLEKGDM